MDDVEKKLHKGYALALAAWQLEIYQARNNRDANSIQRYFNSTPARNAMSRLMFVAAHDNRVYTKSIIAKELLVSRQAAAKIVEECLAEGWIEEDGKGYKAAPPLVNQQFDYTEFHITTVQRKPIRYWLNAIENYHVAMGKSTIFTDN